MGSQTWTGLWTQPLEGASVGQLSASAEPPFGNEERLIRIVPMLASRIGVIGRAIVG